MSRTALPPGAMCWITHVENGQERKLMGIVQSVEDANRRCKVFVFESGEQELLPACSLTPREAAKSSTWDVPDGSDSDDNLELENL